MKLKATEQLAVAAARKEEAEMLQVVLYKYF